MAGGVDQVEHIQLTVGRPVFHAGCLQLDRDAALALQLHVVEELFLHVAGGHRARVLQQPVGQGGFAVVDVGDDAEIADPGNGGVGHALGEPLPRKGAVGSRGLNPRQPPLAH